MQRIKHPLTFLLLIFSMMLARGEDSPGRRPSVGLVLSGGAAKGIAHIGVLKVLEEAGLNVDYIGGTSMGAIVGGLYSIGYSADSLRSLVLSQDWEALLSDEIPRRRLSIEEKMDHDRFFVSFPFQKARLKLPAGVVTGQNIENLFAELCAHVYKTRDFTRFQIPFLCVAVDVETGNEFVFREGSLPAAMRASMAIPSVFAPKEVDDRLYIDGGVVNNFPADHVKAMGADILIGVDVGHQAKDFEEDVDLLSVFQQTLFMSSQDRAEENRRRCDILIKPDITGFGLSSFSEGDSLVARGEVAAHRYLSRFRAVADSLNRLENRPFIEPRFEPLDSMLLLQIHVDGLEEVSARLLTGKLNLQVLQKYTPQQISEAIDNAYSSLFFEKVSYHYEPVRDDMLGEGVKLMVKVRERRGGQLKVGLNYNNTYRASIVLNTTFRNILLNGSKLSFETALGENPSATGRFEKNNGWKPGFVAEVGGMNYNLNFYEENVKRWVIDYGDIYSRLSVQSIFGTSYMIGAGGEFERITVRPEVGDLINEKVVGHFYNLRGYVDFDTYDQRFFPHRGTRFKVLYKLVKPAADVPFQFLRLELEQAIPMGSRLTVIPKTWGGVSTDPSIVGIYHFYLGGMNKAPRKGLMHFVGLDFMERGGPNALAAGLDLQYNFWRSNYIVARANVANTTADIDDLLNPDGYFGGYGLSLGNLSLIGPIELTWMRSTLSNRYIFYVNIGYYF